MNHQNSWEYAHEWEPLMFMGGSRESWENFSFDPKGYFPNGISWREALQCNALTDAFNTSSSQTPVYNITPLNLMKEVKISYTIINLFGNYEYTHFLI